MAQAQHTKIPVGSVLSDKYRITREIGRGGMAAVYEAENIDIGKRVAIKVLAAELTASTVVMERFLREARAAAAVRSPYICDVYDAGRVEDGRPFLVLELLEGRSLYEHMTVVRQLDVDTTLAVVTQVARGLTRAHAGGIVHRDLKPENIFITRDEEGMLLAKILDFGLAKFYLPTAGDVPQARLTREGAVFGTPAYMSPEQVRGQGGVDHRADLWALGCITFECLTGRTVWATEQGVAMTFAQIASAPLPSPGRYRPDLPAAFTAWFERALHRDIERRFQTARELSDELARALSRTASLPFEDERIEALTSGDLSELPEPGRDLLDVPVEGGAGAEPSTIPAPPRSQSRRAGSGEGSDTVPRESRRITREGSKTGFAVVPSAESPRSPSLVQVAPTAGEPHPPAPGGAGRAVVILGALLAVGVGSYAGYRQFLQASAPPVVPAGAIPTASAPPPPPPDAAASAAAATAPDAGPSWTALVKEAQGEVARGDLRRAVKLFKEAFERGGHGVPRVLLEHVQIAAAAPPDPAACQLAGIGRPRPHELKSSTGRPVLASGERGPVFAWIEVQPGGDHVRAVQLDEALRPLSPPRDVTPEAGGVSRAELEAVGERFLLLYADAKGETPGVLVRWLEADATIGGPPVLLAPRKPGAFWPSLARTPDGPWVVWEEQEGTTSDLYLRRLSAELSPQGSVIQVSDFLRAPGSRTRARTPTMAFAGDALHLAFRFERDPSRGEIRKLRIPLADPALVSGLPRRLPRQRVTDRTLGTSTSLTKDAGKHDQPRLACGDRGCFLSWQGEGANVAYLDAAQDAPLWWRKFSKLGSDPAVAVAPRGEAILVWYEGSRLLASPLRKDGLGPTSRLARVTGEQPAPSVAPGSRPGEWYVAWVDYEAGHLEAFGARLRCP